MKTLAECGKQRAVDLAELILDELAARLALVVLDLHAARVVEQHADEVLLRHRNLELHRRTKQREEHRGHQRHAQSQQHEPIAARQRAQLAVRPEHVRGAERGDHHRRGHGARGPKHELALLENQRLVLEQVLKDRSEHEGAILTLLLGPADRSTA